MMSNNLLTSCVQPPASPLTEKSDQPGSLKTNQGAEQENYPSSPSGSNHKTFSPGSRRALKDYLCSSNSAEVSSVDAHTPPSGSGKLGPKAKARRDIQTRRNANTEVSQRQEHHKPKTRHRFQFIIPDAEPQLKQLEDENWHSIYPYPCNSDYPKDDEFGFKPKVLAGQIDPKLTLSLHKSHSDTNFLEPLAIEATIRQEYSVHAAYKQHQHDMGVKKINDERRAVAENVALRKQDLDPNINPTEFPKVSPEVQQVIYADKVELAALTRNIAIHDGHVEGMVAGEFTFHPDTSHLPPTEEQMAVLREAGSLQGLFAPAKADEDTSTIPQKMKKRQKSSTPKSSLYDQWLKKQSSNICPATKWLDEEAAFAKKKAYNKAFYKQIKFHFPAFNSPNMKEPPKVVDSNDLEWETDHFPYLLPKTDYDTKRRNMYETPVETQVPKWFPNFTSYGIVHFNRRDSTEKQYKDFLTQIWRLESKMRSNKNNKWDKKWHEPSARWAEPFQKSSGG
ncbi:hypothetical protein IL306_005449 [Fusarium sp. DS 682]|nr:hypothetical protein IL306_005449 [Fusarium sp. DS 682]